MIKICNEYIVFDAKSPSKDELDHFPKYINTEAGKLSKYADHKDVKKHLFFSNLKATDDGEKIYLAKNPSFTSMIDSLRKTFEDAKSIRVSIKDDESKTLLFLIDN